MDRLTEEPAMSIDKGLKRPHKHKDPTIWFKAQYKGDTPWYVGSSCLHGFLRPEHSKGADVGIYTFVMGSPTTPPRSPFIQLVLRPIQAHSGGTLRVVL